MSAAEFERVRTALGFTQYGVAAFFCTHGRTGGRWAADGPPPAVAMVLRLMLALKLPADEVEVILRNM